MRTNLPNTPGSNIATHISGIEGMDDSGGTSKCTPNPKGDWSSRLSTRNRTDNVRGTMMPTNVAGPVRSTFRTRMESLVEVPYSARWTLPSGPRARSSGGVSWRVASGVSGISPMTTVPLPGSETTVKRPPQASARSRRIRRP